MKKIILTILCLNVFWISSAQDQDKKTTFGLRGGLNLSNFLGDLKGDSKIGLNLGLFTNFKVSDRFAIQPELVYSMQGAQDGNTKINVNYINIPVLFKFYNSAKTSNFFVGPQIGFVANSEIKVDNITIDAEQFINSTDFGFNFGAEFSVSPKVDLGFAYYLGVANIATKELQDIAKASGGPEKTTGTNGVMSLNIAYKL